MKPKLRTLMDIKFNAIKSIVAGLSVAMLTISVFGTVMPAVIANFLFVFVITFMSALLVDGIRGYRKLKKMNFSSETQDLNIPTP